MTAGKTTVSHQAGADSPLDGTLPVSGLLVPVRARLPDRDDAYHHPDFDPGCLWSKPCFAFHVAHGVIDSLIWGRFLLNADLNTPEEVYFYDGYGALTVSHWLESQSLADMTRFLEQKEESLHAH